MVLLAPPPSRFLWRNLVVVRLAVAESQPAQDVDECGDGAGVEPGAGTIVDGR